MPCDASHGSPHDSANFRFRTQKGETDRANCGSVRLQTVCPRRPVFSLLDLCLSLHSKFELLAQRVLPPAETREAPTLQLPYWRAAHQLSAARILVASLSQLCLLAVPPLPAPLSSRRPAAAT